MTGAAGSPQQGKPPQSVAEQAQTIQRLQDELAATNQEVLLLTLDLEHRVAMRTAELSRINESLRKEVEERRKAEREIRKLNEELAVRAEELQLANQELEAFSHSVSHDLRSPLTHIAGYAHLLSEHAGDRLLEPEREDLAAINRAVKRMSQLIEDLLLFSKTSRHELKVGPVNLNDVVERVKADSAPDLVNRQVVWDIAPLPTVQADPSLLRLVLTNLISNAIKYTRPREVAKIEIGTKGMDAGQHVIYIKDNGVGFDPTYIDKLFNVFQRLHGTREFEGTGIGLANVRRIIQRHGGKTWAEGQVNEGATFYFTLPGVPETTG